jgi:phage shock protein C
MEFMMQDAVSDPQTAEPASNDHVQSNVFLRHDTLFGVCQGIGEEFGFNPNFLRVPFAAGILWNPQVVVGFYLGLGAALLVARWIYPKSQSTVAPDAGAGRSTRPSADNADADELHIAA